MAAENTPDAEYQGVLSGLENFSERFARMVGVLDVESIRLHSEKVSTQSQDQMDILNRFKKRIEDLNAEIQSMSESNDKLRDTVNSGVGARKELRTEVDTLRLAAASNKKLENDLSTSRASYDELEQSNNVEMAARKSVLVQNAALKAEVASLQGQVASDKTRIEFFEKNIAAGGDSSKTLTEEVQRLESVRQVDSRALEVCQKELLEAMGYKNELRTCIEDSKALESRLDEAINTGNAASVVNAGLKAELSTLQALYNDLQNESRKITIRNELLAKEILDHYKSGEEEEQAEGAEEEVGDHGPIPDPSPVSIDEVVYIPVVTFVPNNPNAIFNYIMENVYLNDLIPPKFKSTLTKTRGQGILLTEQTLRDLINRLRTGPLAAFSGNETYKHQLQNYAFWGPNETVSYADVARRHLNI